MSLTLWVTQDIEVIHFKGYKKHTIRRFKKFNTLAQAQEELEKNSDNYYIYDGVKPDQLYGIYNFVGDKLQRIDNEASINRRKKQLR